MKEIGHLEKMSLENMVIEHGLAPVLHHLGIFLNARADALTRREGRETQSVHVLQNVARALKETATTYDTSESYHTAEVLGTQEAWQDAALARIAKGT